MDWIELAKDRDGWRAHVTCDCVNELSGSIKCEEIFDYLKNC